MGSIPVGVTKIIRAILIALFFYFITISIGNRKGGLEKRPVDGFPDAGSIPVGVTKLLELF